MARIHDKFIIELAEVIKGYGNDPDIEDPFRLSEFYRFYELPNIAVSRENFEKMRPAEQKIGRWLPHWCEDGNKDGDVCSCCHEWFVMPFGQFPYCPNCGAKMEE